MLIIVFRFIEYGRDMPDSPHSNTIITTTKDIAFSFVAGSFFLCFSKIELIFEKIGKEIDAKIISSISIENPIIYVPFFNVSIVPQNKSEHGVIIASIVLLFSFFVINIFAAYIISEAQKYLITDAPEETEPARIAKIYRYAVWGFAVVARKTHPNG